MSFETGAASEQVFVTPYADPDVSALVHAGLDGDLARSYALGDSEAQRVLGQPAGTGAAIAWPPGGAADASVLTSLARNGDVGTIVLSSSEMPALPTPTDRNPADDAVTSVPNGIGTTMNVLLADSGISADLGSAGAKSPAAAVFSVEQDFLAQTAMIVAEAPNDTPRSVVIAPPRRWDPSESEAAALLRLTDDAPWLRPVALAKLSGVVGAHAGKTHRKSLPGSALAPEELSAGYMNMVKSDKFLAALYLSLLYKPSIPTTNGVLAAVAATESSAWRGRSSPGGWTALRSLMSYVTEREKQVKIISGNKVVLGGTSGVTPVSVSNGLDAAVQVKVRALVPAGSQISIGDPSTVVMIAPQQTQIVRLPVHSAALGSTLVQLQLVTQNGTPLGKTQSFSIESTRFGRALLIVIAAALGVLVLSSLARWIRRAWHEGVSDADGRSGGTG